ncbi:isoleucine--tRNA ligase [Candidatus Curtissbacteria bacterium]|nr:isoleucine--tRNA ligase [Candidatus Curtissbacteria bacterium]
MATKKQFKPVDSQVNFPKLEEDILSFWQKEKIFEKSLENRKSAKKFTFYDGPPFATGLPHYGHILAMTIKDAITRLKTMEGFYVPRRLGWDTHGLPVEYELEKELGISGKKQIEERGVENFNEACREIVFRYTKEWEKTIDRMGRWVDKEDTYATLNTDYMESIWWVFKTLWDKDLIFQGFKSMPYCPRCATPLSNFETNLGYKDDVEDPSVYIKFQAAEDPNTFYLAWTTTPWSLPGNAALAVNPKAKYVKVKVGEQYLILAKDRLEVLDAYEDEEEIKVADLIGKKYKPLFSFFEEDKKKKGTPEYVVDATDLQKEGYRVVEADYVSLEDGSGIVHVAPAFGEEDMNLGQKEKLPLLRTIDKNGFVNVDPWKGDFFKKADPMITEHLDESGNLYKAETLRHTYPFCWRCDTPLLYYSTPNWFVKVSQMRKELVKNNDVINWTPKHIKEGRFGNWLKDARDWSISRNRFWGTPLPVWKCQSCDHYQVVGSVAELKEKANNFEVLVTTSAPLFKQGKQKSSSEPVDLHRPYIDVVTIKCEECGAAAARIEEVLDCWFESGSMPYAQDHYPFENKKEWEDNFPADFIAEGLDQTRGWFYTLHVLATALFDKPSFKNIIVNGILVAADGKKLSKRLRNYPEPDEVFNKFGADAMRYYLLASPAAVAEDVRFSSEIVQEIVRKFFLILWNSYLFFVTYANLDDWQPDEKQKHPTPTNLLDKWVLSKLNGLIEEVNKGVETYNLPKMTRPLQDFITEFSTWYIRRSRDRIGPSADDKKDKEDFYATAHYVLVTFVKLLAPFSPFVADEIYKNLTGETSVHLADWPKVDAKATDKDLESAMQQAIDLSSAAHAHRKQSAVKVRIPFKTFSYKGPNELPPEILKIVQEEVNVNEFKYSGENTTFIVDGDTGEANQDQVAGIARDVIRQIQVARKEADCDLKETVSVILPDWPKEYEELIKKQTLSSQLTKGEKLEIKRS